MKYIIFDYDGTLHNSIRIYEPAFKRAYDYLVNNGYAEEKVFKEDEVSRFLGLTARQMWNDFMPSLPEDEKKKCSSIIGAPTSPAVNSAMGILRAAILFLMEG